MTLDELAECGDPMALTAVFDQLGAALDEKAKADGLNAKVSRAEWAELMASLCQGYQVDAERLIALGPFN